MWAQHRCRCRCVPDIAGTHDTLHMLPIGTCFTHSHEQVINEDYNDFVSLSTKLVNVDGSLQRMQAPLLELQVSS